MKFICDNCKAKYQIGDDKIAGRSVRMKCRRCGHLIQLSASVVAEGAGEHPPHEIDSSLVESGSVSMSVSALLGGAPLAEDLFDEGPTRAMTLEQRIAASSATSSAAAPAAAPVAAPVAAPIAAPPGARPAPAGAPAAARPGVAGSAGAGLGARPAPSPAAPVARPGLGAPAASRPLPAPASPPKVGPPVPAAAARPAAHDGCPAASGRRDRDGGGVPEERGGRARHPCRAAGRREAGRCRGPRPPRGRLVRRRRGCASRACAPRGHP